MKEEYSLPFILTVSILPDVDLLFKEYIVHRGPTHSVVTMTLLFVPIYLYLRRGLPYYVILLSHSLIGDYFTGNGVQLFWPLTMAWYKAPRTMLLTGLTHAYVELALSVLMLIHIAYMYMHVRKS